VHTIGRRSRQCLLRRVAGKLKPPAKPQAAVIKVISQVVAQRPRWGCFDARPGVPGRQPDAVVMYLRICRGVARQYRHTPRYISQHNVYVSEYFGYIRS
jgi:hypothetical protein